MPGSTPEKPINCEIDFDPGSITGKTAIVTGGASGLGEAYVRALHAAKANVVIGDLNLKNGDKLASELPGAKYIQIDVTKWQDQLHLFQQAEHEFGQIHYVVANAGIATGDDVFSFDGPDSVPTEPDLNIIDVNIRGVLYTTKLAMHYFIKLNGTTPSPNQVDTCLILIGSGAAFLDCPRGPQYQCSKWGMRGVMHSLRRTAGFYGSRVNVLSPWYVRTNILTKETFDHVEGAGVHIAVAEDAGQALLRLLSDASINGRMLFIAPRKWAARGYVDLDIDEYPIAPLLNEIQEDQIKPAPVSLGLFTG
ncbi:short chain dehydrogenase reductase family oxidoreductase [Paraphaeosphaeria sporulosa]